MLRHDPGVWGGIQRSVLMATRHWAGCWRYCTFAGEAFDVEMLGLDPKHFAFAWLPTFMAVNDRLLC